MNKTTIQTLLSAAMIVFTGSVAVAQTTNVDVKTNVATKPEKKTLQARNPLINDSKKKAETLDQAREEILTAEKEKKESLVTTSGRTAEEVKIKTETLNQTRDDALAVRKEKLEPLTGASSNAAEDVKRKIETFNQTREDFLATQKELVRANRELTETQRRLLFDTIKGNKDDFRDRLEAVRPSSVEIRSQVRPRD